MTKEKCENCRFFEDISNFRGYCKRYPPTVYSCDIDNATATCSPFVDKTDWCGEFYSKDSPKSYLRIIDGYVVETPIEGKPYAQS